MSIQRVPEAPFAQIANGALRDSSLSFKARGLLAMVLSHSGEWTATLKWLQSQSQRDGRESIQTALNELTEAGYREVFNERDTDGEIRTIVVWKHTPEVQISRPTGNPATGKPDRRETRAALEHHPSEHYLSEHKKELSIVGQEMKAFDFFWDSYPRKVGKDAAKKAFNKASRSTDWKQIVEGARRYKDDPNREPEFTAHPTTWLNAGRWSDEPLPERSTKQPAYTAYAQAANDLYNFPTMIEIGAADEPF